MRKTLEVLEGKVGDAKHRVMECDLAREHAAEKVLTQRGASPRQTISRRAKAIARVAARRKHQ